jgi:hypothetical protein
MGDAMTATAQKDRETARGIVQQVDGYLLGDTARTLANTITLALSAARNEQREQDAKVVPTSWLDPLMRDIGPLGREDTIERLLHAIAAAIRAGGRPDHH